MFLRQGDRQRESRQSPMPRFEQRYTTAREHLRENLRKVAGGSCAEKHPTNHGHRKSKQCAKRIAPRSIAMRGASAEYNTLDTQNGAVIRAPQQESPVGAVPQTSQHHG